MKLLPRRRGLFLACVCCIVVSVVVYASLNLNFSIQRIQVAKSNTSVPHKNAACHLPKLDPFHKSILHLLQNYSELVCPGTPKIFELKRGKLQIQNESLLDNVLIKSVKYQTVERPDGNDRDIDYGVEGFFFKGGRKVRRIQSDFVKVSYRMADRSRKVEMFAQTVRRKDLELKQVMENSLNVVLIGFDSTSNANFRRKLHRSYKYLVEKLQVFVFSGYTTIGDGTTPALSAVLAGQYMRAAQENYTKIDDWPWIMKDYKEHGYVTLYAEDDPQLASFNGKLGGFGEPPTHHYMRPFWLAVEQNGMNGRQRNKTESLHRVCFNSEPLHNITLNYVTDFLKTYRDTLKFAFAYFSYLPHGTGEKLSFADKDLLLFLKNYDEKYRKDSILIIFGDHGARIGPIRNTIQGSYEEHMPWLSIVTPPWFAQKYPDIFRNLKHNQDIVTSPFDLHQTLHHILQLGKAVPGSSLFNALNPQRPCTHAGVDEHYCPCLEWHKTDISSPYVQAAAHMLVNHINKIITRKSVFAHICFTIYLVEIILATKAVDVGGVSSSGNTKGLTYYQVSVVTDPGNGMFQATFNLGPDRRLRMNAHISRTNMYGRKPWCLPLKYRHMRKFCTCKEAPRGKNWSRRH